MNLICRECGKTQELNFSIDVNEELSSRNLCWDCSWWLYAVPAVDKIYGTKRFTFENKHYLINHPIAKEIANKKYIITFPSGATIETNKITCFGEVPEHLRYRYPNNAVLTEVDLA